MYVQRCVGSHHMICQHVQRMTIAAHAASYKGSEPGTSGCLSGSMASIQPVPPVMHKSHACADVLSAGLRCALLCSQCSMGQCCLWLLPENQVSVDQGPSAAPICQLPPVTHSHLPCNKCIIQCRPHGWVRVHLMHISAGHERLRSVEQRIAQIIQPDNLGYIAGQQLELADVLGSCSTSVLGVMHGI